MKNELDSKFLLRVFEKMRLQGTQENGQYRLGGLIAYTDFDGYTLFIEDAQVKMSFGFHNQYRFDYTENSHFEQFEKKLKAIDTEF